MAYPRSRKSNGGHLIDGLITLPWWCSLLFGLIIWGAASLFASYYPNHILVIMLQPSWPVLPSVVGFTALASALKARRSSKSLKKSRLCRTSRTSLGKSLSTSRRPTIVNGVIRSTILEKPDRTEESTST